MGPASNLYQGGLLDLGVGNAELQAAGILPEAAALLEPVASPGRVLTGVVLDQLKGLLTERASRRMESLGIYEPLDFQEAFHSSPAKQRVLRGGNRGGKTLPAAVEVARAVTGQDPHGKYPLRDGRAFLVGRDLKHIGQVMWRKLSRAGAFKIIRDEHTSKWRALRPWDAGDAARAGKAKLSPPLIPPRMIRTMAWHSKAKEIPEMVKLINGWEIYFFSSEGKPPRGSDIDLWWFDEEILLEEWHSEMVARVLDRSGRGIWSATPQSGAEKLLELHDRADEEEAERIQAASEGRSYSVAVAEFHIDMRDNPHIGTEEKEEFRKSLSEEEAEVRIGGEFALTARKVFPEWRPAVHVMPWFEVPKDWTRYVFVDPGRQVCACLFVAVNPPGAGPPLLVGYDELYIKNCSADLFGEKMKHRAGDQLFEAFVLDKHGGRLTDIGSGRNVEMQYAAALKKRGVKSIQTQSGFHWASDDVEGGIEAVRRVLMERDDGQPMFRVLAGKCPALEREIKRYRYKTIRGEILDVPEDRGAVHQMANVRYMAQYPTRFVRREAKSGRPSAAVQAFRDKMKRRDKKKRSHGLHLGPTIRRPS